MSIRENPPACVVSSADYDQYKTLYDDITANGVVLEEVDRHALGELATMLVEMQSLRQNLLTNGEFMEVNGDKGNQVRKRNPSRDAIDKLRNQVKGYFREFKMTPSSRGKVFGGVGSSGLDNDPEWDKV